MLSHGASMLYNAYLPAKRGSAALTPEERLAMPLAALAERISGHAVPGHLRWLILEVLVEDEESGEDVEVPYVKVPLQHGP